MSLFDTSLKLLEMACVIIVAIYLSGRIHIFNRLLRGQASMTSRLLFTLIMGMLSIYGTYHGVKLHSGVIVNLRDMSPMIAGLAGGPVVGLLAGMIGGLHRYTLGGISALPCAMATILIGLAAGLIFRLDKNRIVRPWHAALFAVVAECFHLVLILVLAKPFSAALAVVQAMAVPMLLCNALGVLVVVSMIEELEAIPGMEDTPFLK